MADITTGSDNLAPPVDQTAARPLESSSQALSKPGEAGQSGNAAIKQQSGDMVSSALLPAVDIIQTGDQQGKHSGTTDAAQPSAQALEQAASGVESILKGQGSNDAMAKAFNQALDQGIPLKDMVDQINKDMPHPGNPDLHHAALYTDANGNENLVLGMGPFVERKFQVDGSHVKVAPPDR